MAIREGVRVCTGIRACSHKSEISMSLLELIVDDSNVSHIDAF